MFNIILSRRFDGYVYLITYNCDSTVLVIDKNATITVVASDVLITPAASIAIVVASFTYITSSISLRASSDAATSFVDSLHVLW